MSQDSNTKQEAAPNIAFVTFFGRDGNIIQSSGVSNVTKTGEGEYEVQFTTPFVNKYYSSTGSLPAEGFIACDSLSPTQLAVGTIAPAGNPADFTTVSVIAVGNVS
jgi:hypothetical protein